MFFGKDPKTPFWAKLEHFGTGFGTKFGTKRKKIKSIRKCIKILEHWNIVLYSID